jgi:3-hydroxyisobutyrate dehydrogenase-like beta-hydroxyacid dehydrogenase
VTLRTGFIGLGNQGKPIALHLVPSGFEAVVYDIDATPVAELLESGARAAESPREVAENAEVVGICVPEDDQVRAVVHGEEGLLAGARPGLVIAIHSTIEPATAEEIGALAAERGVAVLDACVTGGAARAAQKQLTYIVGGDAGVLERVRPYLEATSVRIIHAGPLGCGAKLKLCLNLITYIQWAAAYESYKLAEAVGLSDGLLEEAGQANGQMTPLMTAYLALHKGPAGARHGDGMQAMRRGFMLTAEKDLAWALKMAREAEVTLPVGGLVSQMMARLYGVEDEGRR